MVDDEEDRSVRNLISLETKSFCVLDSSESSRIFVKNQVDLVAFGGFRLVNCRGAGIYRSRIHSFVVVLIHYRPDEWVL